MNNNGLPRKCNSLDRKYLNFIFLCLFFLFCILMVQFYRLQIIQGEKWAKEAQIQHQHFVIEPFERGKFYSNNAVISGQSENDQPLVCDVLLYHLHLDCNAVPKPLKAPMAKELMTLLSFSKPEAQKLLANFYKKSRSRRLALWLDQNQKEKIENWWFPFAKKNSLAKNVLFFVRDYKRSYPYGSLLGQVLSTIQEDKESLFHQATPVGGLEQYFHPMLSGKVGKRLFFRSPYHPLDGGKVLEKPQNGADIYLTINHYLQAIAEQELQKGVQKAHAKGGWAIVMNPHTGEILALAQYPFFDPSQYGKYFSDPNKIQDTKPKAVCDAFEPGSIFKPITIATAFLANEEMEKNGKPPLFTPEEKIPTSNKEHLKTGKSKPLKDAHLHQFLNMNMAVQKSSNVYMGKLIQRIIHTMGEEWYRKCLTEVLGFGKKTDIELPAETIGLVPTPGKLHPNKRPEWSKDTPYSLVIGHNILVNSLQMIRVYAIFANGGYFVKPTLVKKIVKKNDQEEQIVLFDLDKKLKENLPKRVLQEKNAKRMMQALKYTTKPGGTAHLADVMGYSDAGKTGTSEKIINGQYSHKNYISSFVGIVPANNPQLVIMVTIDEPEAKYIPGVGKNHMGGICASPVFKEIALHSLEYLGIAPDDPFGYPYGDPRRNAEKADFAKELKQQSELYKKWNGK